MSVLRSRMSGSVPSTDSCPDDAERVRLALDQACYNLAVRAPDLSREDTSIGYQARLWRACLLAGWGGPLGFPFDDALAGSPDDLVPCEWCKGVGFQGPPDPGPCHGCDGAGYFDREASS